MDPLLAEIMKQPPIDITGFNDLLLRGRTVKVRTSFPDHELLSEPGVLLQRLEPESIAALGRSYLPMMQSGFNKQGIAAIFLLAYNLRFPTPRKTWEPVFDDESVENRVEDKAYTTFTSKLVGEHGVYREISPSKDVNLEAVFYSFIATSLLRLFSKPFGSYIRSWSQILGGFSRFYNVDPPVNLDPPSGESIEELAILLGNETYKASLFKLLYAGGGDWNKALGLKRFLYDNYLANTGLHVVELFVKLARVLNCSHGKLLGAIESSGVRMGKETKCLGSVIELMASEQEDHERKMWRYGRIFDEGFMADIATKKSPTLVYALAIALKEVAPGENDGVFNIVQLQDLGPFAKRLSKEFGKAIVKNALRK